MQIDTEVGCFALKTMPTYFLTNCQATFKKIDVDFSGPKNCQIGHFRGLKFGQQFGFLRSFSNLSLSKVQFFKVSENCRISTFFRRYFSPCRPNPGLKIRCSNENDISWGCLPPFFAKSYFLKVWFQNLFSWAGLLHYRLEWMFGRFRAEKYFFWRKKEVVSNENSRFFSIFCLNRRKSMKNL